MICNSMYISALLLPSIVFWETVSNLSLKEYGIQTGDNDSRSSENEVEKQKKISMAPVFENSLSLIKKVPLVLLWQSPGKNEEKYTNNSLLEETRRRWDGDFAPKLMKSELSNSNFEVASDSSLINLKWSNFSDDEIYPEQKSPNIIEKRIFHITPTWLTFSPLKWLTKTEDATGGIKSQEKFWEKLNPIKKETYTQGPEYEARDKIKKLLSLFSVVEFDNGECYENGIRGICRHQTECEEKGMQYTARCAKNLGVCCFTQQTCGGRSRDKFIYFVNNGASTSLTNVCTLSIDKLDSDVVQFRIQFIEFQLRGPMNGTCLHDRLVITGQDANKAIPEICGINTGQHIYIDVDDSSGPYNLNIITTGEHYPRSFRLMITQIKMGSELLSPKNCLQYFTEPVGSLQTFNYQEIDLSEDGTYFNNLNYAICIKKMKGFCSISYENEESGGLSNFHMMNTDADGESLLPPMQAGAETFDCPNDYIIINGIRLCGEKLNDASIEPDLTKNYPIKDSSGGPFIVFVKTDASVTGRGFYLKYKQNPCLI